MRFQEFLDSLPIGGVFVAFAIVALITYEIGFRVGRWWQGRTPDEHEGPTGVLVGSLLALMAFMLAITMGMATDRFDARRGLVLTEAKSYSAPPTCGPGTCRSPLRPGVRSCCASTCRCASSPTSRPTWQRGSPAPWPSRPNSGRSRRTSRERRRNWTSSPSTSRPSTTPST